MSKEIRVTVDDSTFNQLRYCARHLHEQTVSDYIRQTLKDRVDGERKRLTSSRVQQLLERLGDRTGKTAAEWLVLFRDHGLAR